jgi:ferredoxin
MRAVDEDPKKTILSECTLCGNCVDACKNNESSIGLASFGTGGNNSTLLVDRRKFIYSTAAGIISASAIKGGIHSKDNIKGRFVRPPGSIPEPDFLARCIRCGECMKVCKTNGLQPINMESGLDAIWTPRLKPRVGPCEDKCNMCGHVCPTQAIRALPIEEKLFAKIGTAVIDRRRCIAWEQNKLCLICDEICPYDAIEFRIVDTFTGPFKRPFVLEDKCVGCGWCEKKCPIFGRAAIEVYNIGEERFAKGSYVTEQKKKLRELKEDHETGYDVNALGSGGETGEIKQKPLQEELPRDTAAEEEPLPGGFTLD